MLTKSNIVSLINKNYDIVVEKVVPIKDGSADLYIIDDKYVFKYYQENFDVNKIIKGINISNYLNSLNYNVPFYYKTKKNKYYFCEDDHYAILMTYLIGNKLNSFSATKNILVDSAVFYANLELDLINYNGELPLYDLKKYAHLNIWDTINIFNNLIDLCDRNDIKADLLYRIKLLKKLDLSFFDDLNEITICNCHGDYYVSQCLYIDDKINSILDFESAKKMPISIEIIRSYFYLDKEFNLDNFILYVKSFNNIYKLEYYDLKYMPYLYYLKLLRSTFGYEQYINNCNKKEEYLLIGKKLQKQLLYLEKNNEIISQELVKINL